jgi:DNA recombination protein RmuC
MENHFIIISLIIVGTLAWFISALVVKSKTVTRTEWKHVNDALDEARSTLAREQEKASQLQDQLITSREHLQNLTGENNANIGSLASHKAKLESALEEKSNAQRQIEDLKEENKTKAADINALNSKVAELTANNQALKDKLDTQKKEIEDLGEKFQLTFENIAKKILEDKSKIFTEQNKINLEAILSPLGTNIKEFKQKVEEVYIKEAKERFSLGNEVKNLVALNQKISEEATNLTNALKGNTKKQGDWGQMILENILEQSGLARDREYFVQDFLKDEDGNYIKNAEGKKMQPDVIVAYPDDRKVIIDSKVSLTAYVSYCHTEDSKEQDKALKAHIRSMRSHIDDLSRKSYQDFAPSLDFVMMFVPNEPAFLLALQNDFDLWKYAYDRKIILISPTTLIATLKLIVDLWKREYQNQNAQAIAERGAALYDKFVGFVNNMAKLGGQLETSQNTYKEAFGQLKSGNGNLVGQAEKLRELGLKTKKKLPLSLVVDALPETTTEND